MIQALEGLISPGKGSVYTILSSLIISVFVLVNLYSLRVIMLHFFSSGIFGAFWELMVATVIVFLLVERQADKVLRNPEAVPGKPKNFEVIMASYLVATSLLYLGSYMVLIYL